MSDNSEQMFFKHLQSNPPHVITMVSDLIAWMRAVFGEPEWFSNKECNANVRVGKFVVFGLCAGRYPDEPGNNRALMVIRRIQGYEALIERMKSISPKISEFVTTKAGLSGFDLHIDMLGNDEEVQILKNILQDHVAQQRSLDGAMSQGIQPVPGEQTSIIPTEEDFEAAYRMLAQLGEAVSIDAVLDQIQINLNQEGYYLDNNWRVTTEKNIEVWSRSNCR